MSKLNHRIYIISLISIVLSVLFVLFIKGISYYHTSIENRFFHPGYEVFKPSGTLGHGLGITGSLFIIIGISSYMIRKRSKRLRRVGILKHWLEFHIFLCTLGPILILYHTSFKFGGVVSISFWSMVAVFFSGILGRFIYIQIPRTIEGRELSLSEVKNLKTNLEEKLFSTNQIDEETTQFILNSARSSTISIQNSNVFSRLLKSALADRKKLKNIKKLLKRDKLSGKEFRTTISLISRELSLNRRIERLDIMKNLFKYWHVAHLPFALVMLTIMIIHVTITLVLGYKWIF